jgi:hypothetical protein
MNEFLIGEVFSLSYTNVTIPSFSFFWMIMTSFTTKIEKSLNCSRAFFNIYIFKLSVECSAHGVCNVAPS